MTELLYHFHKLQWCNCSKIGTWFAYIVVRVHRCFQMTSCLTKTRRLKKGMLQHRHWTNKSVMKYAWTKVTMTISDIVIIFLCFCFCSAKTNSHNLWEYRSTISNTNLHLNNQVYRFKTLCDFFGVVEVERSTSETARRTSSWRKSGGWAISTLEGRGLKRRAEIWGRVTGRKAIPYGRAESGSESE